MNERNALCAEKDGKKKKTVRGDNRGTEKRFSK